MAACRIRERIQLMTTYRLWPSTNGPSSFHLLQRRLHLRHGILRHVRSMVHGLLVVGLRFRRPEHRPDEVRIVAGAVLDNETPVLVPGSVVTSGTLTPGSGISSRCPRDPAVARRLSGHDAPHQRRGHRLRAGHVCRGDRLQRLVPGHQQLLGHRAGRAQRDHERPADRLLWHERRNARALAGQRRAGARLFQRRRQRPVCEFPRIVIRHGQLLGRRPGRRLLRRPVRHVTAAVPEHAHPDQR